MGAINSVIFHRHRRTRRAEHTSALLKRRFHDPGGDQQHRWAVRALRSSDVVPPAPPVFLRTGRALEHRSVRREAASRPGSVPVPLPVFRRTVSVRKLAFE